MFTYLLWCLWLLRAHDCGPDVEPACSRFQSFPFNNIAWLWLCCMEVVVALVEEHPLGSSQFPPPSLAASHGCGCVACRSWLLFLSTWTFPVSPFQQRGVMCGCVASLLWLLLLKNIPIDKSSQSPLSNNTACCHHKAVSHSCSGGSC